MFPLLGLDTLAQLPMSRDWQPGETLSPPSLPGGDESLLSAQEGPRPHPRVCGFPLGWGGGLQGRQPPPPPQAWTTEAFPLSGVSGETLLYKPRTGPLPDRVIGSRHLGESQEVKSFP